MGGGGRKEDVRESGARKGGREDERKGRRGKREGGEERGMKGLAQEGWHPAVLEV
jgi:hypothetical protein